MSIAEITATVTDLQELKRMREEIDAEIADREDRIKAHMGDAETLLAGPYKVTWTTVTSSRIDTKAIQHDLPDVAARYTKTSTTRRFTVR